MRPAATSHAWASCSRCCIAGYNNIDLAAAKERGIAVCTSPGVNAGAVAEAALMVMLMLTRRYKEQQARPLVQPHSWHSRMRGLHLWGTGPQPCLEQPHIRAQPSLSGRLAACSSGARLPGPEVVFLYLLRQHAGLLSCRQAEAAHPDPCWDQPMPCCTAGDIPAAWPRPPCRPHPCQQDAGHCGDGRHRQALCTAGCRTRHAGDCKFPPPSRFCFALDSCQMQHEVVCSADRLGAMWSAVLTTSEVMHRRNRSGCTVAVGLQLNALTVVHPAGHWLDVRQH